MQERAIQVKVGLLVLVATALFVVFIYLLGDFRTAEGMTVYADFPTSADLKPGAPVKITGVTVGKVQEVQFWGGRRDANGKRVQIRVRLEVDPEKGRTVHDDARAYISTLGVLGEKYVEIDPGSFDAPTIDENSVLNGVPPLRLEIVALDLADTLRQVREILSENRETIRDTLLGVKATVDSAHGLIEENRADVRRLLSGLNVSVERVDRLLATTEGALGDGSDIRESLQNVRSITGKVDRAVDPVVRKVNSTLGAFEGMAGDIGAIGVESKDRVLRTLDRVEGVVTSAEDVAGKIREGRGTIGALLADQELYDDLKELMEDLKRHPWKFIWKE